MRVKSLLQQNLPVTLPAPTVFPGNARQGRCAGERLVPAVFAGKRRAAYPPVFGGEESLPATADIINH